MLKQRKKLWVEVQNPQGWRRRGAEVIAIRTCIYNQDNIGPVYHPEFVWESKRRIRRYFIGKQEVHVSSMSLEGGTVVKWKLHEIVRKMFQGIRMMPSPLQGVKIKHLVVIGEAVSLGVNLDFSKEQLAKKTILTTNYVLSSRSFNYFCWNFHSSHGR